MKTLSVKQKTISVKSLNYLLFVLFSEPIELDLYAFLKNQYLRLNKLFVKVKNYCKKWATFEID